VLISLEWPGSLSIVAVLPDFTCGFRFACVTHTIANPQTDGDCYGANPDTNIQ